MCSSPIKSNDSSNLRAWSMWGLGAAFFFAEYFARVSPGVMVPDLMRDLQVTALRLGSLSAFFYYAYLSMQIPVGILVDRFGPRRLLISATIMCGLGCAWFGSVESILTAELSRFVMGFGAAFAFVTSLKLAAQWFPSRRLGLIVGLTQALGMLGAAVGEEPVATVIEAIGWRYTMYSMAMVFLVLAALMFMIIQNNVVTDAKKIVQHNIHSVWGSLKQVLCNQQSWFNAAYAGFVFAPTAAFAELWGVSFLKYAYSSSTKQAAFAVGMIFIGWGIGGPIVGWLSDRIGRRLPVMKVSALAGLILTSCVIYMPHLNINIVTLLLFLYGVSNAGVAVSYTLAGELNSKKLAGTSMAFANMASVLVGASLQPIIGWFLDLSWNGQMLAGVPAYSLQDFHVALFVLPVCSLLGIVFAFIVRETFCRMQES